MAFLIPDNLKSRQDVPSAIRRTASAFEIGLDDSAVVWYEPLYDASGEKPHLVVMLPERGIAVLEVIDARGTTFLGVLKGKARFLREGVEVPDPLDRASRLSQLLMKRLNLEPRVASLGLNVAPGVCLANLTSEDARKIGVNAAYPPEFCIFKEEIDAAISGAGQSALTRAFTRLIGPPILDFITSDIENTLRGLIQPDTIIGVSVEDKNQQLQLFQPPASEDDIIRVMDRQQEAMAKSLGDGHRVIRGVAGSGKTLILVFRAKLIAENFPHKKVLVTCYTQTLAAQLRHLLRTYSNIEVATLHSLMSEVCKKAKIKLPSWDEDGAADRRATLALEGASKVAGPKYDVVLMDEAQDFGTDEIKFAAGLLSEGSEDLVIVADAAQNIFKRHFSWRQAGVKAQGRTRILRVNYRNTKEILEFASAFLLSGDEIVADEIPDFDDENAVIPPEAAKRSGPVPEIEIVPDVTAEIHRAIEAAKEWLSKIRPGEKIAILYPGADKKDRGYLINRELTSAGIDVYWVNNRANRGAKAGLATAQERVILSTVHSAKGLEFPYVILCGVWMHKSELAENRKLAYVGMTRATDRLLVVSREGHGLFEDLKKAKELCCASGGTS